MTRQASWPAGRAASITQPQIQQSAQSNNTTEEHQQELVVHHLVALAALAIDVPEEEL